MPIHYTADNLINDLGATDATPGSVLFVGSAGDVQQDNSNFSFDDTNNEVLAKRFVSISSGTITRSSNYISTVALTGGRTITVTRSGGYIASLTDSNKTWTFTRDGSNIITSWTVT